MGGRGLDALFGRRGRPSPAVTPSATPEGLQEVDNLVTSPDAQTTEQPTVTPGAAGETPPVQNLPRPPEGTAAGIGADIAVPASAAVDDSYFADAVFVGNSRTQGLQMYGGVTGTTFWTKVGLTVDSGLQGRYRARSTTSGTPSPDALRYASYNKVYIMLGNERARLGLTRASTRTTTQSSSTSYRRAIPTPSSTCSLSSPSASGRRRTTPRAPYTNANVMRPPEGARGDVQREGRQLRQRRRGHAGTPTAASSPRPPRTAPT